MDPVPPTLPLPEPETREAPAERADWASLWRVMVAQTQNAFNDKVAQFTLLGLAKVWLDRASSDRYAHIVSLLLALPLLFCAPLAGWMADRFSKRRIMLWCSVIQVAALAAIGAAFLAGWFWTATALFFALALQAALFQPAKTGIVKEYAGARFLSAASGWAQMAAITALVAGQWAGGLAFEYFYHHGPRPGDGAVAAAIPVFLLAAAALTAVFFSWRMSPTPEHEGERFRFGLLTEHFTHLDDLLRGRTLRLTALGVSFFWFAATLATLILIQLATEIEPNEASQAERSGMLLAFVGAGVAAGSVLVALLSAERIEPGLVPLGGLGMAAAALLAPAVEPGGWGFRGLMFALGAGGAVFLAPLNASLQDQVEPRVRGRMLSAAALLDALAMLAAIALQFLWLRAGLSVGWQFVLLGILCLATSAYVVSVVPQNFLRVTILGLVRVLYRARVRHPERVPSTGGALVVCNHVSYADAVLLSAGCDRPLRFAVYDAFFKKPRLAWIMRLFGAVPISSRRAREAIVVMAETLKSGNLVCLFPEGQLTRTGMMNEVRKGFELIARKAEAPVLPAYMDNLWGSVFSYQGGRYFRKRPRRLPLNMSVNWGQPIPPEQASAERLTLVFRELAAESLMARPALRHTLRFTLGEALCREPWRMAAAEIPERRVSRGMLFGASAHLARRWRDFPVERVAVALPEGLPLLTAVAGLKFAGKTPVVLPPELLETPGLDAFLAEHGIHSVVSTSALRARFPRAPWPEHFLYFNAEMEEQDHLLLGADLAFAALAPKFLRRARLERRKSADGAGWISSSSSADGQPPRLRLTLHGDREILTQVAMLRGTDLFRESDRLLCGEPFASPAGWNAVWTCLLGGIPIVFEPPVAKTDLRSHWLNEFQPTLALGGDAFARAHVAAAPGRSGKPLRAWLAWSPWQTSALSPATAAALAETDTVVCPALTDEASGHVIAVSLPDPPAATSTSEPQTGTLPGSPGRILPGVLPESSVEDDTLVLRFPEGPAVSVPGAKLDESGFVVAR